MTVSNLHYFLCVVCIFLLVACEGADRSAGHSEGLDNNTVFSKGSPYADVLVNCVKAIEPEDYCAYNTLPLIGTDNFQPTKTDILHRVVVSHDWMGLRFAEMLDRLPADSLQLFRAVTAIVIDDDFTHSFYYGLTGAIYIDPIFLWLTNEEKATVSKKRTSRGSDRDSLNFRVLGRPIKNNNIAYRNYSLDGDEERRHSDILYPFSRVLFHELAHANDHFPPDSIALVYKESTLADAIYANYPNYLVHQLYNQYNLFSSILFDLADILYGNEKATETQKSLTADYVGSHFNNEGAVRFYAYASSHEDIATLLEATLMKYFYGVELDMAFTSKPLNERNCSDYVVGWGVRNRLADPIVSERALLVVSNILPGVTDWDQYFTSSLGKAIPMIQNRSWCNNLVLSTGSNIQQQNQQNNIPFNSEDLDFSHY